MDINFPAAWIPTLVNLALFVWMLSRMDFRIKVLEKNFADEKRDREKATDEQKLAHVKLGEKIDSLRDTLIRTDEKLVSLSREQSLSNFIGNGDTTRKRGGRQTKQV